MSEPQNPKKDKFSHEVRLLLASLLSMAVILLWARFFAPKPRVTPPQPTSTSQTAPAPGATGQPATSASPSQERGAPGRGVPAATTVASQAKVAPKSDTQDRTIVVENDLYRVEFSNLGAVVKSWQLKKYLDDSKPQRILDLVHPQAAEQTGGWPFAVVLDDPELEKEANVGLFVALVPEPGPQELEPKRPYAVLPTGPLKAPTSLQFSWSNGHLEITKTLHFDHSYVVRVETSAKLNGAPITAGLAWLGGFGDLTVTNPAPVETVDVYYSENGKLTNYPHKKLEGPEKWAAGVWQGGKDWTGIEDRYFTAAFLPPNGAAHGNRKKPGPTIKSGRKHKWW